MRRTGFRSACRVRRAALLFLAPLLLPPAASAQLPNAADLVVFGVNAALGGTTAGIGRHAHGGSFVEGFAEGLAGGAAVYAGKRIAAARTPLAGLAGRAVGAVGSSVIRNSAGGRNALDRFVLPAGPVSLYFDTRPDQALLRPKLNVGRTLFLGLLWWDDQFRIDALESLASGAPVFRGAGVTVRHRGREAGGIELLGSIALSDASVLGPHDAGALIGHERVHLLQDDFVTIGWADPVEDWLLDRVPGGEAVGRYLDTDAVYTGLLLLGVHAIPYESRPWETEASRISGS